MRILSRYMLKNKQKERELLKESLFNDIFCLADAQFSEDEFEYFAIEIRLKRIEKPEVKYR